MFGMWASEAWAKEAEIKVRELRDDYQKAQWSLQQVRRRLADATAWTARAFWRLSERLREETGHGRGFEGAPDA